MQACHACGAGSIPARTAKKQRIRRTTNWESSNVRVYTKNVSLMVYEVSREYQIPDKVVPVSFTMEVWQSGRMRQS